MPENENNISSEAQDLKFRKEAELLELRIAEAKAEAELRSLEHETRRVELEKEKAEAERELAEALHEIEVHKRENARYRLSEQRRVYTLSSGVNKESAYDLIHQLDRWRRYDDVDGEQRDILIRLKSPGGSVFDGFDMFDHIKKMQRDGWVVNTLATGLTASMAGVLLQVGTTRLIHHNAILHLHEVGSMSFGKTSEVKDDYDLMKKLQRRICEIYAERSGTLTPDEVEELFERKEVHLSATEALAKGFVDTIV
jgi:ATP-dependent Clp protease protease subunit